jgi:hypothetical protein
MGGCLPAWPRFRTVNFCQRRFERYPQPLALVALGLAVPVAAAPTPGLDFDPALTVPEPGQQPVVNRSAIPAAGEITLVADAPLSAAPGETVRVSYELRRRATKPAADGVLVVAIAARPQSPSGCLLARCVADRACLPASLLCREGLRLLDGLLGGVRRRRRSADRDQLGALAVRSLRHRCHGSAGASAGTGRSRGRVARERCRTWLETA